MFEVEEAEDRAPTDRCGDGDKINVETPRINPAYLVSCISGFNGIPPGWTQILLVPDGTCTMKSTYI